MNHDNTMTPLQDSNICGRCGEVTIDWVSWDKVIYCEGCANVMVDWTLAEDHIHAYHDFKRLESFNINEYEYDLNDCDLGCGCGDCEGCQYAREQEKEYMEIGDCPPEHAGSSIRHCLQCDDYLGHDPTESGLCWPCYDAEYPQDDEHAYAYYAHQAAMERGNTWSKDNGEEIPW